MRGADIIDLLERCGAFEREQEFNRLYYTGESHVSNQMDRFLDVVLFFDICQARI